MKNKNLWLGMLALALVLLFSCLLIIGCASHAAFPDNNEQIETGDFNAAIRNIENEWKTNPNSIYRKKNNISLFLDTGLLNHYAGNNKESFNSLHEAERLIEEAFTKSISENFISTMTDTPYKKEYAGEDFENVYVNIFSALNFYQMGNIEDAMVEIRQLNNKLVYIKDSYAAQKERLLVKVTDSLFGDTIEYTNSAMSRYLGMLFWRDKNEDSARIDAQEISIAFNASPQIYSNPMPKELIMENNICEELAIPAGMARINLLCFTGLSPYKAVINAEEIEWRISERKTNGKRDDSIITAGYPTSKDDLIDLYGGLSFRPSPVDRIEVVFDNGKSTSLSLLEDMGRVTQQLYESREIRRSNIKRALFDAKIWAIYLSPFRPFYPYKVMVDVIIQMIAYGSEEGIQKWTAKENRPIDLRMARYLPGKAYVGGINVNPGAYSFTINYYSGNSLVKSKRFDNYNAEKGKLNLIEDFCLKNNDTPVPRVLPGPSGPTPPFMPMPASLPDYPGRLPAPTGVNVILTKGETYYDNDVYDITWDKVKGASLYYLYFDWDGYYYLKHIVRENNAVFHARPGSHEYSFKVMAVGPDGFGVPSEATRKK